jgi:hypothetical protein
MSGANNKVLVKMLDRLFAALVNGPSLNARPHASRQRVDFAQLSRLGDLAPEEALRRLLGEARQVRVAARVGAPKKRSNGVVRKGTGGKLPVAPRTAENEAGSGANGHAETNGGPKLTDAERAAEKAWVEQQALLAKLRVIADDARTYEQDTGVHVLNIGFPLLSLPPGSFDARQTGSGRRILAPIAFIPVAVTLSGGATQNVQVSCRGDGIDLVAPNNALLAWLEQQTGKPMAPELYTDPEGQDPWREVCELVAHVCDTLDLEVPELFRKAAPVQQAKAPDATTPPAAVPPASADAPADAPTPIPVPQVNEQEIAKELEAPEEPASDAKHADSAMPQAAAPATGIDALKLVAPPRAEEEEDGKPRVVPAAVIGLFPMANQGLLRDMQAMVAGEALVGPVKSFVDVGASFFDRPAPVEGQEQAPPPVERRARSFADERLVTGADPFQSRAVRVARESRGLVVHGPPGTGKSQTITNIIGDHLARGQRVLFVCDKRTALDVVYDRLEHMGLGSLCAVIHDPQRDQRELYKAVREQLDALPEAKSDAKSAAKLAKLDGELQAIHAQLGGYCDSIMRPARDAAHGLSLHELMGRWLALAPVEVLTGRAAGQRGEGPSAVSNLKSEKSDQADPHPDNLPEHRERGQGGQVAPELLQSIGLVELDEQETTLRDILARAGAVDYPHNPWARAAGTTLADFLARPMEDVRESVHAAAEAARGADATADPAVPPFAANVDLVEHGKARADLADRIDVVNGRVDASVRTRWATVASSPGGGDALDRARKRLAENETFAQALRAGPPDAELSLAVRDNLPDLSLITQQLAQVAQYLESATKWWSLLAFGPRKQAAAVLNRYGLTLEPSSAGRVRAFLTALRARLVLRDLVNELSGGVGTRAGPGVALPDDAALSGSLRQHATVLDLLGHAADDPALRDLSPSVARSLTDGAFAATFLDGLRKSPARAAALVKLESALAATKLFEPGWLGAVNRKVRGGHAVAVFFTAFADGVDTVEGVLRVREALAALPPALHGAAGALVKQSAGPDEGLKLLRREVLAAEITRRLKAEPQLQSVDGKRLGQLFDQYRELDAKKKDLVRDAVLHRWVDRQKGRLLANTGSRLNAAGADLRRRMTTRGERAMRLRQVVAVGKGTEGGDPLFDLRPVWMASPETVAQVFPREPIFDVVVFDEASQCRLEEALPVLVRGKRVTIAGDPRQLPPTRFFESAVAASDDDGDVDSDQELFEIQQGETEDLLGAALGLDIQQCYLDVHYRSRSADLIEFSNEHFYGSRLQPIPGHPSRRPKLPPVRLVRADGVYEKRGNEVEAERVVEIVRELLGRKDPPSIGVACFNLQQRNLIVEKLDEAAEEDVPFARKLAEARARRGAGSFEGLFVKNLENVQGDERDHIIISTTYGPGPNGKFYRRFGPLGRAGGGRRLNVLVTRAREQVHVVTSIPAEAYRGLPEVPSGQTPGGGWLLFAYLKFAEGLGREYEGQAGEAADAMPQAAVRVGATKHPSPFAEALAHKVSEAHDLGADVHWGNEGFCVDVALRPSAASDDVTVGVLCDAARFAQSEDPTEWDAFRTAVLEKQGWTLRRVWTPHFFRDPRGAIKSIASAAALAEQAGQGARQTV